MSRRERLLLALIAGATLAANAGLAWAGAAPVAGLLLPSRRPDTPAAAAMLDRMVAKVAALLGTKAAPTAPTVDLDRALARAHELRLQGAFDESAATLDAALESAARNPQRIGNPTGLIAAHVERITIGLARGEGARAADLLERLLRYDPGFHFLPGEESPRLRAALAEARARVAGAPFAVSDIGEACREMDIALVARMLDAGLEIIRFDRCRIAARAMWTASAREDEVVRTLAGLAMVVAPAQEAPRPPSPNRWPFLAGGLAAAAVAAAGGTLLGIGRGQLDELGAGCGPTGTCAPTQVGDAQSLQWAGVAVLAVGAAALAADIIWALAARRHPVVEKAGGRR